LADPIKIELSIRIFLSLPLKRGNQERAHVLVAATGLQTENNQRWIREIPLSMLIIEHRRSAPKWTLRRRYAGGEKSTDC